MHRSEYVHTDLLADCAPGSTALVVNAEMHPVDVLWAGEDVFVVVLFVVVAVELFAEDVVEAFVEDVMVAFDVVG